MYRSPFRIVWLVLGLLVLGLVVTGFVSVAYNLYLGHYPIRYDYFPVFGFGWLIVMILFGVFAVRLGSRPWRYRRFDPAMLLLRQRYARGEITKEQFSQMAQDLQDTCFGR